jgi:hypothetical protein
MRAILVFAVRGVRGARGSSVPLIIEGDDLRPLALARAWCGLFQSRSGELKIK